MAARRARAEAERERAEAELREIAAQRAAQLAEAEAEGARQEPEQQAARARMAEMAARLAGLVADARQSVEEIENRERERQAALKRDVQELLDWKPPTPRMSPEELAPQGRQLHREIAEDDRRHLIEEERQQQLELDRQWRRRQAATLEALRAERDRQLRE